MSAGRGEAEPAGSPRRQLLVDVSTIAQADSRTGIQRVVRAVVRAFPAGLPPSVEMRLVAANPGTAYRYLPEDWLWRPEDKGLDLLFLPEVQVRSGDIFFGLDLAVRSLPAHEQVLAEWRRGGVSIHILLYDLLPLNQGQWFRWRTRRNFRRWLATVQRNADQVIAISKAVADEMRVFQASGRRSRRPVPVSSIKLAGDIAASAPSTGLPPQADRIVDWVRNGSTVLMVGTVEPRKGHKLALGAFQELWRARPSDDAQLLVVGAPGWKTQLLQRAMRELEANEPRFRWLDQVSDEMLQMLYGEAKGVLMASEAEGFGLPLLEALSHARPVLARDLPVFREFATDGITFFDPSTDTHGLSETLHEWLGSIGQIKVVPEKTSWSNTIDDLCKLLGLSVQQASRDQTNTSLSRTTASDLIVI
jgi:glycosyltransferase involved in cell wall biosynthesis